MSRTRSSSLDILQSLNLNSSSCHVVESSSGWFVMFHNLVNIPSCKGFERRDKNHQKTCTNLKPNRKKSQLNYTDFSTLLELVLLHVLMVYWSNVMRFAEKCTLCANFIQQIFYCFHNSTEHWDRHYVVNMKVIKFVVMTESAITFALPGCW